MITHKLTYNITRRVRRNDPSIWPHTILLRIRSFHLKPKIPPIKHSNPPKPNKKATKIQENQTQYLKCNMITSLITQLHRTRDLLLQLNFQNKHRKMTSKLQKQHKNKSNQIWICDKIKKIYMGIEALVGPR